MISALSLLLLAATNPGADKPAAALAQRGMRVTATASATILPAEKISYRPNKADKAKTDRQYSRRGNMPMVEFF